jgi:hypothetical protein
VITESDRANWSVAASNAVLAGIAAADAICCERLGERHQGEDHQGAVELLKEATRDSSLASKFGRLLSLKSGAQYGALSLTAPKARDALKWAGLLVDQATVAVEFR